MRPPDDAKKYPLSSSEAIRSGSMASGGLGSSGSGVVHKKNYLSDENPVQKTSRSKKDKNSRDNKRQTNKDKESSMVTSQIDKKMN